MSKPSNKHATRQIKYLDFTGGINTGKPPEVINENEQQINENFELNLSGKIKGRGGLSSPFLSFVVPILGTFYDYEMNVEFVFLTNGDIYKTDFTTSLYLGSLTGSNKPMCAKFGGRVVIASGGKLQSYDYTYGLKTIAKGTIWFDDSVLTQDSPDCDICFVRFGRIATSKVGEDNIRYSGTGDEANWLDDDNDDSSSKYVEIGYKDGGDIVCVKQLSTDLIIFKSNGKVYQLSNEYPDWSVYEIGTNSGCKYMYSADTIGTDIVFLSTRGLMSLGTVSEYGNFKMSNAFDKFNKELTTSIYHPTIWHLSKKNQLILKPTNNNTVYAFHYAFGALTKFIFPEEIVDIEETDSGTLIATGNHLHWWDDSYVTDNGTPINFKLKLNKITTINKVLLKKINYSFEQTSGSVRISSGMFNFTVDLSKQRLKRSIKRLKEIDLELSTTVPLTINHILMEIAEL